MPKAENHFRIGRSYMQRNTWELLFVIGMRPDLVEQYMLAPVQLGICVYVELLQWRLRINGAWYFRPWPFRIGVHVRSDRKLIKEKTRQEIA